jgi:replicative DNA helicase
MTAELALREPPPADHEPPAPPQDIPAEMAVLGGMMLSADAIADVDDTGLRETDFYRPAHRTIYNAILRLYARGEPTDALSVANTLGVQTLMRVGGAGVLADMIHGVPSPASAGWYAGIVRRKAIKRRLIEAGVRIAQLGQNTDDDDLDGAVDRAQSEVLAVADQRDDQHVRVLDDLLGPLMEGIEQRAGGTTSGIRTGFTDLDAMLGGGMQDGQMVVLAARPAIGKSTLGLDIAREAAIDNNLDVLLFSMEMSTDEIMQRLMAAEAKVLLNNIRTGKLTDEQWPRITDTLDRVAGAPLHIDDSGTLTITDIRTKARRLAQQLARDGRRLRMVVVDYLQLITATSNFENRQAAVAEFSRALKLLAKDLGIPVIAISQLNRNSEQRSDHTPNLADLRESGAIENDADVVILLFREDEYYKPKGSGPRVGEADFIVAKNRNGPTGTVSVAFQGHFSRFVDMAKT